MNLTLNNLNIAANAKAVAPVAPAPAAGAAAPVADAADESAAEPAALLADAGAAVAQAPVQPVLAFAQWLGLEQPASATDTAAQATPPAAEQAADEEQAAPDTVLLGAMAMAMPLMPVAQVTLAAVAAALPGVPAPKEAAPAADTEVSLPGATAARGAAPAAAVLANLLQAPVQSAPLQSAPIQAAQPTAALDNTGSASSADNGLTSAVFGNALAAHEGAADQAAAPAERAPALAFGVSAPAAGSAQRGADSVTLSGPPTAWRQTLQEALGDRLQMHVSKGSEQAVIKLEPPMLGRVEIAIRHSAGSLEVHISATHGEVLRQLQNVSETLRNDLAQRQFTDVAVNVAPAPRSASATPQFAGDSNGRGRQQEGREQDQTPGNALGEANTGAFPFSLNGRA